MPDALHLGHTLGTTKRGGSWQVPEHLVLRQRMGSSQIDLTEAILDSAHTTLDLDMIGGSVEIRVPDTMTVRSSLYTTLASYQDHRPGNDGPATVALTITGRAIWGSVEVRGPRRRRWRR